MQAAYPRKKPLAPTRTTLLANALHCYNRVNGFQQPRRYFNGKFFAIRDWRVPTLDELRPRLAALPEDRFYDFHSGMRVDDIWLSRDVLWRCGPGAILEVERGEIWYRPRILRALCAYRSQARSFLGSRRQFIAACKSHARWLGLKCWRVERFWK